MKKQYQRLNQGSALLDRLPLIRREVGEGKYVEFEQRAFLNVQDASVCELDREEAVTRAIIQEYDLYRKKGK